MNVVSQMIHDNALLVPFSSRFITIFFLFFGTAFEFWNQKKNRTVSWPSESDFLICYCFNYSHVCHYVAFSSLASLPIPDFFFQFDGDSHFGRFGGAWSRATTSGNSNSHSLCSIAIDGIEIKSLLEENLRSLILVWIPEFDDAAVGSKKIYLMMRQWNRSKIAAV